MSQAQFDFTSPAPARRTDPHTSHLAARSITRGTRAAARLRILRLLAETDATDEEIARVVPGSPSGRRTARSELVDLGAVVDVATVCCTRAGRRHTLWGITAAGREILACDDPAAVLDTAWRALRTAMERR